MRDSISSRFASGCRLLLLTAVSAASVLMLFEETVYAQSAATGTIIGALKDPNGYAVPGAEVTVRNVDTGIDRHAASNDAGLYQAAFLQPGHYEVIARKQGLAEVDRKGLTLQVGQTLSIDLAMPLSAVQEMVTVTGEAPVVDPDKTEQSEVVDQALVNNLPIAGRRWDNFVLLTPAVTNDGGSGLVAYRGISGLYNNNSVDGANNNQAFFSEARGRTTVPYVYSLDSIQEFQVTASDYSAEFGQAGGGVVNAVTKSGTNTVHGDLFYYLRYPKWNALDPVNRANGIYTQPVHQQQQFGGSVGGPLIKEKLFYFLTYDGSRRVFPIAYTTAAKLPLPCPATVTAAQCAAGNNYIASLLGAYPRSANGDVLFGKLDYQLNQSNHLSANFDWNNYHAPNSYNTAYTAQNNSVTANGTAITHERIFVTTWDSTLSARAVNQLRFQWGRDLEQISANDGGPSVTISNVMAYGEPNALPRPAFPDEHRLQFTDTLSLTNGRHSMKIGADVNAIHEVLVNLFQGGGIYSYLGTQTAAFDNWLLDVYNINTGATTGKHYSTFTQVNDPITGVGRDDFYDNDVAGFFEDSWKARPNLTFNMGIRWEIQHIPQPPRPNTLRPILAEYTTWINEDTNNFGPRFGVAWQPTKKTVVRGGYGMFYAKSTNSTFYTIRVENGVFQQTYTANPLNPAQAGFAPTFPNLFFTPPGPAVRAPFPGAVAPQIINTNPSQAASIARGLTQDFVNPLVHEGELTIEEQLPGNMSLSAGYLFSRGLHLPVFTDANVAPASTTRTYDILGSPGAVTRAITEPFYTSRIDPRTGVVLVGSSTVNSWYNALVVTLHKPFSHGVEVLANYTFSKAIDDGQVAGTNGTFNGTDYTLDPYNQRQENALSDLDQRHRFVASGVWDPFENVASRPAQWLLRGFKFSSIVTIATGQPVTGFLSGFPSGGVDGGVTGGLVSNTGSPTGGRIPQVGRNVFTGPSLHNVDFRIARDFTIRERLKLQLLGEAFNIFNHPNISSVNTTAYNYIASGAAGCGASLGVTGCLSPSPTFLTPTSATNNLYGARQLQVSAKLVF